MTVEQMYEGILPSESGLTTRRVETVAVDPFTGQPIIATGSGNLPETRKALTAAATVKGSSGRGFSFDPARASVAQAPYPMAREVIEPGYTRDGVGFEAGNAYGPQYRLVPEAPALTAASKVAGGSGFGVLFNPTSMRLPGQSTDTIALSFDPMSDVSGQNMANSRGAPIRFASGKVYYPMPEYGPPPVAGAPAVTAALAARELSPGGSNISAAPAVAAFQRQGLSPSAAYDAANRAASERAMANATSAPTSSFHQNNGPSSINPGWPW